MNRPLCLLAVLSLMSSLLATCALAEPDESEVVRKAVAGFAISWNAHDMDAFGKLFAPDADFVNVGGVRWVGRQDIQLHHAWSHGAVSKETFPNGNPAHYGMFKHSTMKFDQVDVRFLRKDVAVAHVNWELLDDARTATARHGVLLFVLTRQDGAG
jgi:uncharacterized protein (TIGR02246 family)